MKNGLGLTARDAFVLLQKALRGLQQCMGFEAPGGVNPPALPQEKLVSKKQGSREGAEITQRKDRLSQGGSLGRTGALPVPGVCLLWGSLRAVFHFTAAPCRACLRVHSCACSCVVWQLQLSSAPFRGRMQFICSCQAPPGLASATASSIRHVFSGMPAQISTFSLENDLLLAVNSVLLKVAN